ncbi:MAG: F0F1 ATP synthase subunit gamma [Nannocystales bacterium]
MDETTLQRRRDNSLAVREILVSMRALSGVQLRRGHAALQTVRKYENSIARGLLTSGFEPITQPDPVRVMLIVLGSDQGMCGALTRHLVERAVARIHRLHAEVRLVVAVGRRTRAQLEAAGHRVDFAHDAPVSVHGVDKIVGTLATHLERELPGGECCRVEVVYNRHVDDPEDQATALRVYPPRPTPATGAPAVVRKSAGYGPLSYEPLQSVLEASLLEWTYAAIYRCALESLTAEHDARLRTTDAAIHTLDDRLDDMRIELNRLRQEGITNELQELFAGSVAQRAPFKGGRGRSSR